MQFPTPLMQGRLLRRYKRFLADVELDTGRVVTAHTPNTGSMAGCCTPGARVWLRDSGSTTRRYPLGWEIVEALPGVLVGINTALPPVLVREALAHGRIDELAGYGSLRTEVHYGREGSRIDLLLEDDRRGRCYVEIKNVTLAEAGVGLFPDAVSVRAGKHLRELQAMVAEGHRGVIFFCVQRGDVDEVRPADHVDPAYGRALRSAIADGVEAIAWRARVTPRDIELERPLPVACGES